MQQEWPKGRVSHKIAPAERSTRAWICLGLAVVLAWPAFGQAPATGPATAPSADSAAITKLIQQLGAAGAKERNAAQGRLQEIGMPAIAQLTEAAKSTDAEVAQRAQMLLTNIRKAEAEKASKAVAKALIWSYPVEGGVVSPPAVVDGTVVAVAADGKLLAVDAATGKEAWNKKPRAEQEDGVAFSQVAVRGGSIVTAAPDGHVYCLSAKDGKEMWTWKPAVSKEQDTRDINSAAANMGRLMQTRYLMMGFRTLGQHDMSAVGPDVALSLGEDGFMHVFDIATAKETTAFKIGDIAGRPVLNKDMVFMPMAGSAVQALDLKTGKELWKKCVRQDGKMAGNAMEPLQIILRGNVLYCRLSSSMAAMDAKTGDETWRATIKDATQTQTIWTWGMGLGMVNEPVMTDDTVYIACGLTIHVYDLKTGKEKRTLSAKRPKELADSENSADMSARMIGSWISYADGGLAVAGSTAYLGFGGYLLAVDLESGATKWELRLEGVLAGAPVVRDGVLYFGTMPQSIDRLLARRPAPEASPRPIKPGLFALKIPD